MGNINYQEILPKKKVCVALGASLGVAKITLVFTLSKIFDTNSTNRIFDNTQSTTLNNNQLITNIIIQNSMNVTEFDKGLLATVLHYTTGLYTAIDNLTTSDIRAPGVRRVINITPMCFACLSNHLVWAYYIRPFQFKCRR